VFSVSNLKRSKLYAYRPRKIALSECAIRPAYSLVDDRGELAPDPRQICTNAATKSDRIVERGVANLIRMPRLNQIVAAPARSYNNVGKRRSIQPVSFY
jgi:hypothetical protein